VSNFVCRAIAAFALVSLGYAAAPATPTFSVPEGSYTTTQNVGISTTTPGASIYYTINGIAPTTSSYLYTAPVTIPITTKLRAIASLSGMSSGNLTVVYTIVPAADPTFDPPAALYTGNQLAVITSTTSGAVIYYTTNGLAPTTTSPRYVAPVPITTDTKLRAIAQYPNGPPSAVVTGQYLIRQSPTPVKTPNAATTFFGLVVHNLLTGTPWPAVSIGTLRLWDTKTLWRDLNPAVGQYTFSTLDKLLALAKTNNAQVYYTFGGTPPWALAANVPITSIGRSAGVVTVTTASAHGLYYNSAQPANSQSPALIAGVADASFNGTFYITATPSFNTLTYAQTGSDAKSSAGTFSAVCSGAYVPGACAEAPVSLGSWDQFITQLVIHVGTAIPYWGMWNEANIPDFWKGDPAMMVTMVDDARRIIKSSNLNAAIMSPSVSGVYETPNLCNSSPSYCGAAWLDQWLKLGGKDFIDGVAFHAYPVNGKQPEKIQGATNLMQSTLANNGLGNLPLWDTESSWGDNSSIAVADQPAWVARHLLLAQSMGVQRVLWYSYDSATWGNLWTSAGLTAGGVAYQQVEQWISGTTLSAPCAQTAADATTFVCGYTRVTRRRGGGDCDCKDDDSPEARSGTYSAQAIWNTAGSKAWTVDSKYIQYRDVAGKVHSISGGTVTISTSPILVETGTVGRGAGKGNN
jgi:hypothetical protein